MGTSTLTVALAAALRLFHHGSAALMAVTLLLLLQARGVAGRPAAGRRRRAACAAKSPANSRTADPQRFSGARNCFTRFAGSGGTDRANLGRAVSRYVSTSAGGARQAAQRMGASRSAGARLLGFLVDAQARGCARPCARSTWSPWQVARSPRFSWAWPTTSAQAQAPSMKASPVRLTSKPSLNWPAKG